MCHNVKSNLKNILVPEILLQTPKLMFSTVKFCAHYYANRFNQKLIIKNFDIFNNKGIINHY